MLLQVADPPDLNEPIVAPEALARDVAWTSGGPPRRIILSLAPCRSGSTALLRMVAALGVEAHLQPLKNLLRWRLVGGAARWRAPRRKGDLLYLKETLGPFTVEESRFDPLAVLSAAGCRSETIILLLQGRDPLECWASWRSWWGGRTSVERLITAYTTAEAIRRRAEAVGIATTVLVYEALRDHPAAEVARRLCERLSLPYSAVAAEGWERLPQLGAPGSNVVIPHMPEAFVTDGIRGRVERAGGLHYFSRAGEVNGLPAEEVAAIETAGLPELYDRWRRESEARLGLTVARRPL